MPSRSSYLLIISGRLKGDYRKEKSLAGIVEKLRNKFSRPEKQTGKPDARHEKWPEGFALENYGICVWQSDIEPYGQNETQFTFRAELHHSRHGTLFDNRDTMIPEVQWFYNYRDYQWHNDLVRTLREVNEKIVPRELLVEPIWFQTYQWYCGNNGP